ncbi:MAG: hypothetical protein WD469_00840 [Paenibacillaceae bacterium]
MTEITIGQLSTDPALLKEPDRWYDALESLPAAMHYDFIMETLEQPLSAEFIDGLTLAEDILDLQHQLQPGQYVALIEKLRMHPCIHNQEFQYFEDEVADYYLFLEEEDKVAKAVGYYMERPIQGIDQLKPMLDKLIYYGKTELAIRCCRKVHSPLQESTDLMSGSADELDYMLFVQLWQQAYLQRQAGLEVDWLRFKQELADFNYVIDSKLFEQIQTIISRPISDDILETAGVQVGSQDDRYTWLKTANWMFAKEMLERKNFDFACGESIWSDFFVFLEGKDRSKMGYLSWEEYFDFTLDELDGYIARKIGGFLAANQASGFAMIWGAPYIYDFLLSKNMIGQEVHSKVMVNIARLKMRMLEAFKQDLWKYSFVNRWVPADGLSVERLEANVDRPESFRSSFHAQREIRERSPQLPKGRVDNKIKVSGAKKKVKKAARKDAKKQKKKNR